MLAEAPQRINPKRYCPPDPSDRFDWQKTLTPLFDGTANCPMGRHVFADDQVRREPVKRLFVDTPAPRVSVRVRTKPHSVEARALMSLAKRDQTARELSAGLRAHEDTVRAALRRLRASGQIRVVGVIANTEIGKGQRGRLVVYGVRAE